MFPVFHYIAKYHYPIPALQWEKCFYLLCHPLGLQTEETTQEMAAVIIIIIGLQIWHSDAAELTSVTLSDYLCWYP